MNAVHDLPIPTEGNLNVVENEFATSKELIDFARDQGLDLEPFQAMGVLSNGSRFIAIWRKREHIPGSGRADEPEGGLHYSLQGCIRILPRVLKDSVDVFRQRWTESGKFDDMRQAFDFVKAWLIDRNEVDELPDRQVRSYGI